MVEYTDQVLTIPADICKIIERENLLDNRCDDFGLSFEIENGKVKVSDLMYYIVKGYEPMESAKAWHLVRKWLINLQEENKVDILIDKKEKEIRKLQNEVAELTNIKENEKYESKSWRFWKK